MFRRQLSGASEKEIWAKWQFVSLRWVLAVDHDRVILANKINCAIKITMSKSQKVT